VVVDHDRAVVARHRAVGEDQLVAGVGADRELGAVGDDPHALIGAGDHVDRELRDPALARRDGECLGSPVRVALLGCGHDSDKTNILTASGVRTSGEGAALGTQRHNSDSGPPAAWPESMSSSSTWTVTA